MNITLKQARRFILLKNGLLGRRRFAGKRGVLEFIEQAGCIQFDPIDVCGKNPELVLHSRVAGFTKDMLYELLYADRELVDYLDKNMAIMRVCDWKYFRRDRELEHLRSREQIGEVCEAIKAVIRERGFVSSADIDLDAKVDWYWGDTRLSRAALEAMYYHGELAVHHKKGTVRYYSLAEDILPPEVLAAPEPYPDDIEHMKFRVLRRIGAVGLLWNRPSDAWLNIPGLKSAERNEVFGQLEGEGKIFALEAGDLKLYCLAGDRGLLEYIQQDPKLIPRCEFLAPLDNMLWDRNLIRALFGFDYKWEIYTPVDLRRYGHYVLPLLYGDRLIGRAEIVNEKKTHILAVKNIWFEDGVKPTKALDMALERCLERFAEFNGCGAVRR